MIKLWIYQNSENHVIEGDPVALRLAHWKLRCSLQIRHKFCPFFRWTRGKHEASVSAREGKKKLALLPLRMTPLRTRIALAFVRLKYTKKLRLFCRPLSRSSGVPNLFRSLCGVSFKAFTLTGAFFQTSRSITRYLRTTRGAWSNAEGGDDLR